MIEVLGWQWRSVNIPQRLWFMTSYLNRGFLNGLSVEQTMQVFIGG
jgi:hypothetical protein